MDEKLEIPQKSLIKTTDRLEKNADFHQSIAYYWNLIANALNDDNDKKYHNILEYGFRRHIMTVADYRFNRMLDILNDRKKQKIREFEQGGNIKVSQYQMDQINKEYAAELYEEIQALGRRNNLIGIFTSPGFSDSDDLENLCLKGVRTKMKDENGNFLGVISGPTGSGKTYTAIQLGILLDKNFDASNIVFNVPDCLRKIKEVKDKKGSVIVFDEAGVGAGSRDWHSNFNKQFNRVMETFRLYNLGLIFTLPSFFDLDKKLRGFLHARIDMIGVDRKENKTRIWWRNIRRRTDEVEFLDILERKGGTLYRCNDIGVPKPDDEIIKAYEKHKKKYADNLLDNSINEVTPIRPTEEKTLSMEEMKDMILKNPEEYQSDHGKITSDMIITKFGLGSQRARVLKSMVEIAKREMSTNV